jgi:hypothetical protein
MPEKACYNCALTRVKRLKMKERDVVLSTRLNSVALATAYRFYKSQSLPPRSKSDLIAQIAKDFARVLVHNNLVTPPTDVATAAAELQDLGIVSTVVDKLSYPATPTTAQPTTTPEALQDDEYRRREIFNSLLED